MSDAKHSKPSSPPILGYIGFSDIPAILSAGLKDFRRAPAFGLFFSAFFVLGGIVIYLELTIQGREYWVIPLALGFPLLAPFLAVGLYEVSRRLETGEELDWSAILGVVFRQKDRQCPSMAMVLIMFFMFWVFVAHLVFALFMGLQPMTNIMSNWQDTLLTQSGLTMLAIGTLVGSAMAYMLFSLTAISIPMLLDREMDFITAMINSFQLVAKNMVVMITWGVVISMLMFLAMLPFFLGLFLVLPVLGHATWHLYRRTVSFED
ncbi:MAG: DUF2189 domain-containing protein [Rhodobacteraceae bacterium]|nr:DUF2189 domain-containing protein [Paracoccaceae bacterium]